MLFLSVKQNELRDGGVAGIGLSWYNKPITLS